METPALQEKSTALVWICFADCLSTWSRIKIRCQATVTSKRLTVVVLFTERKEMQTDAEGPRAGARLVRWLRYSEALPAQNMWLVRRWQVLSPVWDSHRTSALQLSGRRKRHAQRHVGPTLPLQPELLRRNQRRLASFSQPAQRHPHLLALITHTSHAIGHTPSLWKELKRLFTLSAIWCLKFAPFLHWRYTAANSANE